MSGYKENYRFQIIKSGVGGFDKMLEREANEGVPINKPRTYEEDQRQKKSVPRRRIGFEEGVRCSLVCPSYAKGELAKSQRE